MNIKLTPNETQIFHQLQQAAWTLQSLPADLQSRPAGLRSAWPEMCRKTMIIYGQTRRNMASKAAHHRAQIIGRRSSGADHWTQIIGRRSSGAGYHVINFVVLPKIGRRRQAQ